MKTEFENQLANGIDEANRRIFFGKYLPSAEADDTTGVDQLSIEYAVRAIHKFATDNKRPIEIHMNSYGGDPASMLYLHDLILSTPVQFKFFGGGNIMSSATWIMAVCDERYLYKNTTIMVHKGHWYGKEKESITDAEIRIEEEKRFASLLETIYEDNSRMPKEFWAEVCKRDLTLTSEETVMLGLADKIIEPKKRGSFRKIRMAHLAEDINANKLKKVVTSMYKRIQAPKNIEITLHTPKEIVDETMVIEDTVIVEPKPETTGEGTDGKQQ